MWFSTALTRGLAAFYSELLGLPVTYRSDDWVVVAATRPRRACLPARPGTSAQLARPGRPQQVHLDIMVEDVTASGPRVWPSGR